MEAILVFMVIMAAGVGLALYVAAISKLALRADDRFGGTAYSLVWVVGTTFPLAVSISVQYL